MPVFTIRIVNEHFAQSNNHEVHSLDRASSQALRGALEIGVDEVVNGKSFFAAEIRVETANEVVGRFMVSIGASPLQLGST